jgi:hypothetical protein
MKVQNNISHLPERNNLFHLTDRIFVYLMRHFTGNFLLLSVGRAILYAISFKMAENVIIIITNNK